MRLYKKYKQQLLIYMCLRQAKISLTSERKQCEKKRCYLVQCYAYMLKDSVRQRLKSQKQT